MKKLPPQPSPDCILSSPGRLSHPWWSAISPMDAPSISGGMTLESNYVLRPHMHRLFHHVLILIRFLYGWILSLLDVSYLVPYETDYQIIQHPEI